MTDNKVDSILGSDHDKDRVANYKRSILIINVMSSTNTISVGSNTRQADFVLVGS